MPSPGGLVSGMVACHPADLPPGYHTAVRERSLTRSGAGCVEGRPRPSARSACSRSTGWHWQARGAGRVGAHLGHIRLMTARYPLTRRGSGWAGDRESRSGRPGSGRAWFGLGGRVSPTAVGD
jgi:hypothetical protein